jgi:hypothetical protein
MVLPAPELPAFSRSREVYSMYHSVHYYDICMVELESCISVDEFVVLTMYKATKGSLISRETDDDAIKYFFDRKVEAVHRTSHFLTSITFVFPETPPDEYSI